MATLEAAHPSDLQDQAAAAAVQTPQRLVTAVTAAFPAAAQEVAVLPSQVVPQAQAAQEAVAWSS